MNYASPIDKLFSNEKSFGELDSEGRSLFRRWATDPKSILHDEDGDPTTFKVEYVVEKSIWRDGDFQQETRDYLLGDFNRRREAICSHYKQWDEQRLKEREEHEQAIIAANEESEREQRCRRAKRRDDILQAIARRSEWSDWESLSAAQPVLATQISDIVDGYKWGNAGKLALDEDEDAGIVGGAIWKRAVSKILPSPPTEVSHESSEDGSQTVTLTSPLAAPQSLTDTRETALTFLKSNPDASYTYNQVANATDTTWQEAVRACQALVRETDSGVINRKTRDKAGKPISLFQYAPSRKAIDRDPGLTNDLVKRDVLALVTATPAISHRRIRESIRRAYGSLDNAIIDRGLKSLIAEGEVYTEPGPRRANMHYARSYDRKAALEAVSAVG